MIDPVPALGVVSVRISVPKITEKGVFEGKIRMSANLDKKGSILTENL